MVRSYGTLPATRYITVMWEQTLCVLYCENKLSLYRNVRTNSLWGSGAAFYCTVRFLSRWLQSLFLDVSYVVCSCGNPAATLLQYENSLRGSGAWAYVCPWCVRVVIYQLHYCNTRTGFEARGRMRVVVCMSMVCSCGNVAATLMVVMTLRASERLSKVMLLLATLHI